MYQVDKPFIDKSELQNTNINRYSDLTTAFTKLHQGVHYSEDIKSLYAPKRRRMFANLHPPQSVT